MTAAPLRGLIAATYTPLYPDGQLNLGQIDRLVDHLMADGVDGLYVCGSTGEGMSLSSQERRNVAQTFVQAAAARVPVIVQVGHNSLAEARELATHAQQIGASVVSATCPSYFKINTVELLVDCMAQIAAGAPDLPFYYYHIPALTGTPLDMVEFLRRGAERIPNLVGLKYTVPTLHEYQACAEHEGGRFDILWGVDEMLLGALAFGARGAVGSTYNIAAPLYREMMSAFLDRDMEKARRLQSLSVKMIRRMQRYPFHPAMKEVLRMLEVDCGPCRLPLPPLRPDELDSLRRDLTEIGFFEFRSGAA
jgi:N-acetylneuraminate lyase